VLLSRADCVVAVVPFGSAVAVERFPLASFVTMPAEDIPVSLIAAADSVPVNVGLALKTIFPVPVAPVLVTPSKVAWPVTESVDDALSVVKWPAAAVVPPMALPLIPPLAHVPLSGIVTVPVNVGDADGAPPRAVNAAEAVVEPVPPDVIGSAVVNAREPAVRAVMLEIRSRTLFDPST